MTTDTDLATGRTAGVLAHSKVLPDAWDQTLSYLSAVAAREARRRDVQAPVPPRPEHVGDIMVTSVVTAHEGALFTEIVDALIRNRVSAVPVIDADRRVLGVVSKTDLLARVSKVHLALPRGHRLSAHSEAMRRLHAATARELMTSPAVVTSPRAGIADAARHATLNRVRRLPVVEDDGRLVGMVTRSDLLRMFLRDDERVCQDILQNLAVDALVRDPNRFLEVDEGDGGDEGVVTRHGQIGRGVSPSPSPSPSWKSFLGSAAW